MNSQEWRIRNRKRNRPKRHLVTGVWQYGGFRLNLKLVLYLQSQCLTESLGFLNPPHRQAPGRYVIATKNITMKN